MTIDLQQDLIKFGYRPNVKAHFFNESFDILATCWNQVW
jgi:hypothetical protein